MWKILVKFRSCCSDFAEVVPGGVGEIMVLDVVANVKVKDIPNAQVVVGL